MALKQIALLALSEVGGTGFSGTTAHTLKGSCVARGAVAALKVSSLCLPATDVPYSRSKLTLHAVMTHYGECTWAFGSIQFYIVFKI